jgi:hypothetical protein
VGEEVGRKAKKNVKMSPKHSNPGCTRLDWFKMGVERFAKKLYNIFV